MIMSDGQDCGDQRAWTIDEQGAGMRLDVFLARGVPELSRAALRRAIQDSAALVDGRRAKPAYILRTGQRVTLVPPQRPPTGPLPEDIPIVVLYEDDDLVAVDKPPGMVVHPAKGHWSGTLAGALAHHFQQLSTAGGPTRPGIVHRLDRDTSGVLLVAKSDAAHHQLARQFADRETEKEYFAIVAGAPDRDRDVIDRPIGKHPYQRQRMAIRAAGPESRGAETYFEVVERFDGFAALKVVPKTGRTHQIRVHLASAGCPVLCDRLYGGRAVLRRSELIDSARGGRAPTEDDETILDRQALHARRIKFTHPRTGEPLEVSAPLPLDLSETLAALRLRR
jgi:23S rRNA pseudouridine1911/1915/1917 synthase